MKNMVLEHFESETVNYGSEDTLPFVVINVAIAHVDRGIGPDYVRSAYQEWSIVPHDQRYAGSPSVSLDLAQ
jgi:hypothetical protein